MQLLGLAQCNSVTTGAHHAVAPCLVNKAQKAGIQLLLRLPDDKQVCIGQHARHLRLEDTAVHVHLAQLHEGVGLAHGQAVAGHFLA